MIYRCRHVTESPQPVILVIQQRPLCRYLNPPRSKKDFQFYAAKDREMARDAEFDLMIWDGKSPGTVLNVLRVVGASKKAILITTLEKRALPNEWLPLFPDQVNLESREPNRANSKSKLATDLVSAMDEALAGGDPKSFVDILGRIARKPGLPTKHFIGRLAQMETLNSQQF